MLAAATKPVVAGMLMRDMRDSGLTPLVLVWYDSIFSIGWFFLIALCLPNERVGAVAYMHKNAALGWGLILILVDGIRRQHLSLVECHGHRDLLPCLLCLLVLHVQEQGPFTHSFAHISNETVR